MNDSAKSNLPIETLDQIPNILPVLPLRDVVLFPYMIFPVLVGRETSLRAAAVQALNEIGSPYLEGLMDKFFDGVLIPLPESPCRPFRSGSGRAGALSAVSARVPGG